MPNDQSPTEKTHSERLHPIVAVKAIRALIRDKEDTSQVFKIMRALSGKTMKRNYVRFEKSPVGRQVLENKIELIDTLTNRDYLASLPGGTLGAAYYDFVSREQISPEGLVEAGEEFQDEMTQDEEGPRFARRIRDQHDLWHTLTGYGRDGFGEVCVVAFSYGQTTHKGFGLIALIGAMHTAKENPRQGVLSAAWQAYRAGRKAAWLIEQDWEALLERPLSDVRTQLNINEPSKYKAAKQVIENTGLAAAA
jgi:ubiquinone biosynthesis protein COQ4